MLPKDWILDFCGFHTHLLDSYVTQSISVFTILPALKGFFVTQQQAFFSDDFGPLCDARRGPNMAPPTPPLESLEGS